MAEQLTLNQLVPGSSPGRGTTPKLSSSPVNKRNWRVLPTDLARALYRVSDIRCSACALLSRRSRSGSGPRRGHGQVRQKEGGFGKLPAANERERFERIIETEGARPIGGPRAVGAEELSAGGILNCDAHVAGRAFAGCCGLAYTGIVVLCTTLASIARAHPAAARQAAD